MGAPFVRHVDPRAVSDAQDTCENEQDRYQEI